ncbi:MAG: hypothetical protein ACXWWC_11170, partial [Chitinophagaceae bacterium]
MKTIYLLVHSIFRNINFFNIRHKNNVPSKNKFREKSPNALVNFLSYKFLKDRISLLFCFLFFSTVTLAQTNPEYTRSYLNNVVEIGLSDFGLITGEDSTNIYFIAVRRSVMEKDDYPEKIANTIKQVKFYGNSYKAKATKVIDTRVGAFSVVLYKSAKPASSLWQRNYYNTMAYKKGKLSTFRDKWLSDRIWAVQEAKISIIKQLKVGMATVRVPKDAGIAKGMPLVNSDGFIGGIFAESTLGKTVVHVINMKEIANALYAAARNKCRYFNMVEWGKSDIRCVLEENERLAALEKAKLDAEAKLAGGKKAKKPAEAKDTSEVNTVSSKKKEIKKHFLDYGINANILTNPLMDDKTNGKDNYLKTRVFHVGVSLHLNIDKKGLNRITLKPRYGNFYERKDAGLWTSPDNEVTITTTSYQYIEMPVVLERQIFRGQKFSVALGAGYSAGRLFNQQYSWLTKTGTNPTNQTITGSAIRHRLLGELYLYESGFGRLG